MDSDRIKELEFLSGVTLRMEGEINLLRNYIKTQFELLQNQSLNQQNINQQQQNQLLLIPVPVVNTFSVMNTSSTTNISQDKSIIYQDTNGQNKYPEPERQSFILKSLLNKGKNEPVRIQPKPAKLPNEIANTDETIEIICDTRSEKVMEMSNTGGQVISFGDKNSNSDLINQQITFTQVQTLMTDPLSNYHQNEPSIFSSVSASNPNVQTKPKTKRNTSILKSPKSVSKSNLSLTNDKTLNNLGDNGPEPDTTNNTNVHVTGQILKKPINFKCIYCNKGFQTFSKRARHITECQRTQHTHLPFKCLEIGCNMYFRKLGNLERHRQVDHIGLKCQFCPEIMYSTRLLYRHVEDVHFICGIKDCYKKFLTKIGLVLHKKRNHPNKRNHFVNFKTQFIGTEKITTRTLSI